MAIFITFITFSLNSNAQTTREFKDTRDGKSYNTVKIGNQEWMAENLRYKASQNGFAASKPDYYTWKEANRVCPNGWHLPSVKEYEQLVNDLGGNDYAGAKLISSYGWEYDNGGNHSGFNATSDGYYENHLGWRSRVSGKEAHFWSSSNNGVSTFVDDAYILWISAYHYDNVYCAFDKSDEKDYRLSVRCVRPWKVNAPIKKPAAVNTPIKKSAAEAKVLKEKNQASIQWANIPAGTFTMGSPTSEVNRSSDETQHKVTLSAFKMSKYEVTFAQYDAFCDATGREKPDDEGWGRGNRPVINVSWHDATAFAEWMGCRLPTEAEWEYACRAGTITPFNTGNNLTTSQANYDREKTLPVGSFAPNAWGLYDMHGNVWEWCSDFYGVYNSGNQTNPKGSSSGSNRNRVLRGGSWNNAAYIRSAVRFFNPQERRYEDWGFRLVSPK